MRYVIHSLPWQKLVLPLAAAGEALVRLDERAARSSVGSGLRERLHYADAIASLWVDGELVHMEDLVFHDARMDTRTPTHELTIAHLILRSRRELVQREPSWAFSDLGLLRLRGRDHWLSQEMTLPMPQATSVHEEPATEGSVDDAFQAELDRFDAVLKRSETVLDGVGKMRLRPRAEDPQAVVYDPDWNEEARLAEWQTLLGDVQAFPPVLAAACLLDAWQSQEVSEHSPWLGRLLAAAYLQRAGVAQFHLPALSVGLRAVPREQRQSPNRTQRLLAILEAFEKGAQLGLKEHDRLILARGNLERRAIGKRGSSKLPDLIDLVLSRPLVSAGLVAKYLEVTPQGALGLIRQLPLRELTGRGRYRAWGIL
ncbi:RHE_PE00001 family protein [Agrobacterium vitis]|uniref:RHE_PE00001 family protein n=1 Tax=Agrobacterium vitis TaxID=373 RepID=UPI001F24FA3D|nr:RHE_PE00001 family protein [Agrobacterium vitis]